MIYRKVPQSKDIFSELVALYSLPVAVLWLYCDTQVCHCDLNVVWRHIDNIIQKVAVAATKNKHQSSLFVWWYATFNNDQSYHGSQST